MNPHKKTYMAKPAEVASARAWWVVDADGKPLGRLATVVADKLRGKDKPTYTPHVDAGDFVIVVNAAKVKVTGRKATQKTYHTVSGWLGNMKTLTFTQVMARDPELPIRKAVWGMLPKGPLGRQLLRKLKIYAGAEHPHAAQQPKPFMVK
jgi:large subunit ribosomal protein L13